MRKRLGPCVLLCFLSLVVASVSAQEPKPNSCPTHITSCGCVITTTGTYVVDNNLNANQSRAANCIEIAADHTVLNLKGLEIQGNGTGIGILIRRSADHTVVEGGDEGDAFEGAPGRIKDSVYTPDAGDQASIFMWNIAVEDDADYAVIALFRQLGGNKFQEAEGNNTGLFLNGVTGSVASDFDASYNHAAGVMATNSTGVSLHNFSATGTNPDGPNVQPIGVMFDATNNATIATASMAGNRIYGLWLARSSRNVVFDSNGTSGNSDTGILIGCGSLHCTGNQRSDDNKVTSGGAPGNKNYGIVIENKNHNNVITVTHNDGNGTKDMVDLNNKCDSNIWYNNTGTSNQSCIH